MSSTLHLFLLILLFFAAIAVLSSTVLTLIGHLKKRPSLKKAANIIFWISLIIMLILLQM